MIQPNYLFLDFKCQRNATSEVSLSLQTALKTALLRSVREYVFYVFSDLKKT